MTIIKLAFRGIKVGLGRLGLTVLAITLGVGFVSGSFIISDSLGKLFDGIVSEANAGLDARVQAIDELSFGQQPGVIPDTLVDEIQALNRVADAEGFVVAEGANRFLPLDADDEPFTSTSGPTLAFSYQGEVDGREGGFEQVEGVAPTGPGSVNLNIEQAEDGGFAIGDTITFQTPEGRRDFELDGLVDFPAPGVYFVLFDLETAQELFDKAGQLDEIAIQAAPGTLPSDVLDAVEPLLPDGVEVIDQAAANSADSEDFNQIISILGNILLAFALIALFVSLFIIYNTFAILVSQRIQEIGLLRAIGATGAQIRSSILIEAGLVGALGSVAGIGAGIGVAALIEALFESQGGFPETTTVISLRTVLIAIAVGLLATMVSALIPAFKAGRISPVEAIRQEGSHPHRGRGRIIAGSIITVTGLAAVGFGLSGSSGVTGTLALLGIGAVFTFVGVALLSGLFAGPAVMILGRSIPVGVLGTISGVLLLIGGLALVFGGLSALVFASGATGEITIPGQNGADDQVLTAPTGAGKVLTILLGSGFGVLGVLFLFSGPRALADGVRLVRDSFTGGSERKMVRIARENSARSPQRTAATATALMIGLALVTLVSVLGESLRASLSQVLSESVGADLFVNGEFGEVLPDDFAIRLSGLEGIDDVSEYRSADVRVGGPNGEIYGVDSFTASTESRIIDYGLDAGSFDGVADGTAVIVSRSLADDRGLDVGDRIALEFEDLETEDLKVAGIAANENFLEGSFITDNGLFIEHNPDRGIESIGATIADDVDFETVSDAAKALADDYAGVQVLNNEDLQEQLETGISALLVLINGLLGLALVVAFFGVVNTIVLSVLERTHEIGLLRAVGMTRQQLMSTIRWEAIMVSLFGTLLGITLGILFGIAGVRAIPNSVISEVSIPWLTLLIIVIMAGLIGVLAAYLPARRAAKLNPLDAIASL